MRAFTVRKKKSAISDDGLSRVAASRSMRICLLYVSLVDYQPCFFVGFFCCFSRGGWLCSLSGVYMCVQGCGSNGKKRRILNDDELSHPH